MCMGQYQNNIAQEVKHLNWVVLTEAGQITIMLRLS